MTIPVAFEICSMNVEFAPDAGERTDAGGPRPSLFRAYVVFSFNACPQQGFGFGATQWEALDRAILDAARGIAGIDQALRKHPVWLRVKVHAGPTSSCPASEPTVAAHTSPE